MKLILFFSFIIKYTFLNSFLKKTTKIFTNNSNITIEYYDFDSPILYDDSDKLFKEITIKNTYFDTDRNNTVKQVYTQDAYIDDLRSYFEDKYGAYKNPTKDSNEKKKKKKKITKKNINEQLGDIFKKNIMNNNKNKKADISDEKKLVFFVHPSHLNHLKYYNKTMNREKNIRNEKNNNTVPHGTNNDTKLPDGWNDDDFYLFF